MYVQAFKDLNIEIEDFIKLDQEKKFKAIADAVRDSADADKSKSAVLQIMGMRAGELIPMLKAGAEGFDEIAKSVNVVSKQGLKDIEAFNDEINRMKTELMTLAATKLPPILNELLDYFHAMGELHQEGEGFWKLKGSFGIGGPSIRERIGKKMAIRREQRSVQHMLSDAKSQMRVQLDRYGVTGTDRENILSQIKNLTSENLEEKDFGEQVIKGMQQASQMQQAIQTQQEFFPKDAGKSSTLLDHILGELQKVNQSGIEIKGRGINDVQLSQEPTSNAFE
jgi:hypothetical protein